LGVPHVQTNPDEDQLGYPIVGPKGVLETCEKRGAMDETGCLPFVRVTCMESTSFDPLIKAAFDVSCYLKYD